MLAGLPRAPTHYNPVYHLQAALSRMQTVLHLLRSHGYLRGKWQIRQAMREAGHWHFAPTKPHIRYPQFVQYVVNQLQAHAQAEGPAL